MSSKKSVLSASGIVAGYTSRPCLNGISLEISKGSAPIGITGETGTGKTTLVNVLFGALKPARGYVTFGGQNVRKLVLGSKKRFETTVRKVSQNGFFGLDTELTVRAVIANELKKARKAGRASGETAEQILDTMFLEPRFLDRKLRTMSGGERQRLSIALALATRPDVLVLDEPTTALDPTLKDKVSARLRDLVAERNIGLLVLSHDLHLLSRLCEQVHVLDGGTFVETGTPRDLLTNPQHPTTQGIAAAYPEAVRALS